MLRSRDSLMPLFLCGTSTAPKAQLAFGMPRVWTARCMKACMVTNRRQEGKRQLQRRSQQLQRRGREREIENTQGLVLIVALVQSMLQILLLVHLLILGWGVAGIRKTPSCTMAAMKRETTCESDEVAELKKERFCAARRLAGQWGQR